MIGPVSKVVSAKWSDQLCKIEKNLTKLLFKTSSYAYKMTLVFTKWGYTRESSVENAPWRNMSKDHVISPFCSGNFKRDSKGGLLCGLHTGAFLLHFWAPWSWPATKTFRALVQHPGSTSWPVLQGARSNAQTRLSMSAGLARDHIMLLPCFLCSVRFHHTREGNCRNLRGIARLGEKVNDLLSESKRFLRRPTPSWRGHPPAWKVEVHGRHPLVEKNVWGVVSPKQVKSQIALTHPQGSEAVPLAPLRSLRFSLDGIFHCLQGTREICLRLIQLHVVTPKEVGHWVLSPVNHLGDYLPILGV